MATPKVLMGYLMMAGGAGAIVYALVFIRWQVSRTRRWSSVEGTVVGSRVKRRSASTGYDHPNKVYAADIVYRYKAKGRILENNVIKPGGSLDISLQGRARSVADQYPEGQKVTVYFNPENPKQSCLERAEEVSLFYAAIGVVFIIVGWLMTG